MKPTTTAAVVAVLFLLSSVGAQETPVNENPDGDKRDAMLGMLAEAMDMLSDGTSGPSSLLSKKGSEVGQKCYSPVTGLPGVCSETCGDERQVGESISSGCKFVCEEMGIKFETPAQCGPVEYTDDVIVSLIAPACGSIIDILKGSDSKVCCTCYPAPVKKIEYKGGMHKKWW